MTGVRSGSKAAKYAEGIKGSGVKFTLNLEALKRKSQILGMTLVTPQTGIQEKSSTRFYSGRS